MRQVRINWSRARLAATAATLAYAEGDALAARAGRAGLTVEEVLDDPATGANACLLVGDGLAIVAVRGTEKDFRDILTDLDIRKRRLEHADLMIRGRVHAGFRRQERAIRFDRLAFAARKMQRDGREVIACGHSLGGAVAVLLGLSLELDEVYSFGAPRIGDQQFARVAGGRLRHHRFTRAADVVPHLPLLGLGFRHDAKALYFDGAGRFAGHAPLWRQWASLAWRSVTGPWMRGPFTGFPFPARPFTDHSVATYEGAVHLCAGGAR